MGIQNNSGWRQVVLVVQLVSVPDALEELRQGSFSRRENLSRVTFGESSSLKRIRSGIGEIHIPDGVEDPCEECFAKCETLSRVTFGESSSLKLIGMCAFCGSGVRYSRSCRGIL